MKYYKKVLPSGLRVIVLPMKDSPTVTVLTMVETGSEYEKREESGMSHFLEHMCFKGTKNRPKSIDISLELDKIGAANNAFTNYEWTGYYAKANSKHVGKLIDVISDMYLNPTFPAAELEKEKGVIIEEMNMYEGLPQRKVQMVFSSLLYGDQPAGWPILGNRRVIKNATREKFVSYRNAHYVAHSSMVVIAGGVEQGRAFNLVKKTFKDIKDGKKRNKRPVQVSQKSPRLKIADKETDQTHLVLGFKTFKATDKRSTTLHVLDAILGSGMSSRLFQRLREEMGVCYYAKSSVNEFTDHGDFIIFSGVDSRRIVEVVTVLVDEVKKLKDVEVPKAELEKAKESYIGGLFMGVESSDEVSFFAAEQEILGRKFKTPKQIEAEIRKVTAKDVQKLARQIFTDENLNLAIVGSIPDKKKIQSVLHF